MPGAAARRIRCELARLQWSHDSSSTRSRAEHCKLGAASERLADPRSELFACIKRGRAVCRLGRSPHQLSEGGVTGSGRVNGHCVLCACPFIYGRQPPEDTTAFFPHFPLPATAPGKPAQIFDKERTRSENATSLKSAEKNHSNNKSNKRQQPIRCARAGNNH